MIKASAMNVVANIVVARVRKSAVRRTPNTVPKFPPPKVPARPPPLLFCIKITIINKMLTMISIATRNEYIISYSSKAKKSPHLWANELE